MNEQEKAINLMNEGFLEHEIPKSLFEKIRSKKWLIMRRGLFFSIGFISYLIYS